jgi:hypothetical protein
MRPDAKLEHAADANSTNTRVPPPNPDVADDEPSGPTLTDYDEEHAVTYVRMLDADAEGADWREVSDRAAH